jgi:hypothetical protein
MAEAWGCHPETVMQSRRGALWGRRWGVYQDIKARIEKGGKPAPATPDGEPEWMVLERQARERGEA